ncbi:MAG TPA: hypothetical protein VFX96_09310 [Pyrinomonadaceae bacterium]|nr:hypothetical protein [Pyrinomonadaceae bacterium]
MSTQPKTRKTIATHAVLAGLTPLIPVPVVDDLAKSFFRQRLVTSLAAAHGRVLAAGEAEALAAERETGCLGGCVGTVVLYPLKKVFRKIFFFLEWKRAVDLTSRTYHFGYLVDHLFAERLDERTGRSAAEVGAALDAVCREAPIKPLEAAVGATFRQSRGVVAAGASLLERSLRRVVGREKKKEVERAVESVEAEEERQIEPVVTRLQRSVEAIPDEHFRRLREQLAARLATAATSDE